jgi:hypothetical protein
LARKKPAPVVENAGDGEGASDASRKKGLLKQGKDDYKAAEEWWADNRKKWKDDAKFRIVGEGNQWPEDIKRDREAKKLPVVEVDKVNQYVRQVVNDGRQNRPQVKVRPVDDKGDIKVADTLQGLVRHIWAASNADEAVDTALDHAVGNGFGFFRVLADWSYSKAFTQELTIKRIPNALAVLISQHERADGSDMRYGFVVEDVAKSEFKRRYPKAKETNWKSDAYGDGWSDDDCVKVCEYYYKVEVQTTLYQLDDGTTATAEEYAAAQAEGLEVPAILDERPYTDCKVKWCRMTGAEILEERDWLGKYIPIIPVFGNESNIEGKVVYSGLVRAAKDPQRLHNYARASFATRVALSTKAPWLAAAEQIADYEKDWANAHTGNIPVLRYKHLAEDGSVIPPPIRISPTDVPTGYAQDAQMSEHDIQASMGMYANTTLGVGDAQSGRQELLQQKRGDTSTFHYQDNLNRAIRYLGTILVDAAPKYYDTKRVQRILGEDGSPKNVQLNPDQDEAVMQQGRDTIYNLGIGTYDVVVESGPSFLTRREESAAAMMEAVQGNPQMWTTHGDLIAKAQDWPGAEEWAERSKAVMPPQLQQAIAQSEAEDGEDPAVAQMRQQMQQLQEQAQQAIQQREQALSQQGAELQAAKVDKSLESRKLDIEAYKAETERMTALAPAIAPEQISQIVMQTVQAIMAQPVPSQPPGPMPPPIQPPQDIGAFAPPQPNQPPPGGFFFARRPVNGDPPAVREPLQAGLQRGAAQGSRRRERAASANRQHRGILHGPDAA